MAVIDNLAPGKNKHIKGTLQDWFDAKIMEKLMRGISFSKNLENLACMLVKIAIRKQGMKYKKLICTKKSSH